MVPLPNAERREFYEYTEIKTRSYMMLLHGSKQTFKFNRNQSVW